MTIKFQITFKEWLEWRRKSLSTFNLALLQLAEVVWLPLLLLLVISLLLTTLSLVDKGPAFTKIFPSWTFLVILVLLASARIVISFSPTLTTPAVKRDWQDTIRGLSIRISFTENGFEYEDGKSAYNPSWSEVAQMYQTKRLFILCSDEECALMVPKRAFASKEQFEEFRRLTYRKIVTEREGERRELLQR